MDALDQTESNSYPESWTWVWTSPRNVNHHLTLAICGRMARHRQRNGESSRLVLGRGVFPQIGQWVWVKSLINLITQRMTIRNTHHRSRVGSPGQPTTAHQGEAGDPKGHGCKAHRIGVSGTQRRCQTQSRKKLLGSLLFPSSSQWLNSQTG